MTTIENGTTELTPTNTQDSLKRLNEEVRAEYIKTQEDVYKEALRSLLNQEANLSAQIASIQKEVLEVIAAKQVLEKAYLEGKLQTKQDARKIVQEATSVLAVEHRK